MIQTIEISQAAGDAAKNLGVEEGVPVLVVHRLFSALIMPLWLTRKFRGGVTGINFRQSLRGLGKKEELMQYECKLVKDLLTPVEEYPHIPHSFTI